MNLFSVNGSEINGCGIVGNNALLSGGVFVAAILGALLISDVVLAGGIETTPEAGGRISQHLRDGAHSASSISAKWFITTVLPGGAHSHGTVSSNLGRAPGLTQGIEGDQVLGGQVIAAPRLQGGLYSLSSDVDAGYLVSSGLQGGVTSTGYCGGFIIGSTVLLAEGCKSNSVINSPGLFCGVPLPGGIESNQMLGAAYHYPAILSGGIFSAHAVGHEIDVSPRLQGGMVHVGGLSGVIIGGAMLRGGCASFPEASSQYKLSSAMNGGMESGWTAGHGMFVDAVLTGCAESADVIDSLMLKSSQVLIGGCSSTSSEVAATLLTSSVLAAGASSANDVGASLRANAVLHSGAASGSTLAANLISSPYLQGGASTGDLLTGNAIVSIFLRDTSSSDCALSGSLRITAMLGGAVGASEWSLGGDIVELLDDPLLNTWALEIASATEVLEIATPEGDV